MKLFAIIVCITGALAGGGHHGGGGGGAVVQPIIIAPQPYIAAQPIIAAPRYIQAAPRYIQPIHSYAPVRHVVQPVIQRHVVQPIRRTVVQPVERTIIQPIERTVVQPVQRTIIQPVEKYIEPVHRTIPMPLYEKEFVEEKVFRTPLSKTVTEGADDVHRIKRTLNKHYPMLHETVTNHYTIQDQEENDIVHHYYDEKDNFLGMRKGRKFSGSTQHVQHPGESFELSAKFAPEHIEQVHVLHEEAPLRSMDMENVMRSASSSMGSSGMVTRSASSSMGSSMDSMESMDMERAYRSSSSAGSRAFHY